MEARTKKKKKKNGFLFVCCSFDEIVCVIVTHLLQWIGLTKETWDASSIKLHKIVYRSMTISVEISLFSFAHVAKLNAMFFTHFAVMTKCIQSKDPEHTSQRHTSNF